MQIVGCLPSLSRVVSSQRRGVQQKIVLLAQAIVTANRKIGKGIAFFFIKEVLYLHHDSMNIGDHRYCNVYIVKLIYTLLSQSNMARHVKA